MFDKFPLGNLQEFLLSEASITFDDRLRFFADIPKALAALDSLCAYYISHKKSSILTSAVRCHHGDIRCRTVSEPINEPIRDRSGRKTCLVISVMRTAH